jgi:hypothetical protein
VCHSKRFTALRVGITAMNFGPMGRVEVRRAWSRSPRRRARSRSNFVSRSADREPKKADSFHAFKHANDKFSTGAEQRSNSAI